MPIQDKSMFIAIKTVFETKKTSLWSGNEQYYWLITRARLLL